MTTLMQASRQWATRPADERFLSLLELQAFTHLQLENSRSLVFSSRKLEVLPDETDPKMRGLLVGNPDGTVAAPTHWCLVSSALWRRRPRRRRTSGRASCRHRSSPIASTSI